MGAKANGDAARPASKLAAREPVELASELAKQAGLIPLEFMLQMRKRLPRCRLFFELVDVSQSTFKIEILAMAPVGEDLFAVPLRTGRMSLLMTQERMDAEVDLMVLGMAKSLGISIFTGKSQPIPEAAFKPFVEPA